MEKPVSAADANRNFSKLLRAVREGKSFVVSARGSRLQTQSRRIALPDQEGNITDRQERAMCLRQRQEV